jgi:phosphoribosyl 1,2-cyclic phosphodiesterase
MAAQPVFGCVVIFMSTDLDLKDDDLMSLVYSLCSSSKGNCTYVGNRNSGILIDAGVGIRNFALFMKLAGIDPQAVKAIFITHEHSDHIKGLKKLTQKLGVPVIGSTETLKQLLIKDCVDKSTELYEIHKKTVQVCGLQVSCFNTSHDSVHSLGYTIFTPNNKKISICTDLGFVSGEVSDSLVGSDFVLLESNYDEAMLQNGIYPWFLKQRISGEKGHLSNDDCSNEIMRLVENGTKHFLLGHLSEENNRPDIAFSHTVSKLMLKNMVLNTDFTLDIAPKNSVGKVLEVV